MLSFKQTALLDSASWRHNDSHIQDRDFQMIITTTPTIAGREVDQYLDVISCESVMAVNFLKDIFTHFTDMFGGRSATLEKTMKEARATAMRDLRSHARRIGAGAVVGLQYQMSMPFSRGGFLAVVLTGTAVRLKPLSSPPTPAGSALQPFKPEYGIIVEDQPPTQ